METFVERDQRYRGRGFVFILVVDASSAAPSPKWRERIAAASRNVSKDALVVFVSESTMTRGIVTAINWLRPPPYTFTVARGIAEAIDWVDGRRPGLRILIRSLYVEARKAADSAAVATNNDSPRG